MNSKGTDVQQVFGLLLSRTNNTLLVVVNQALLSKARKGHIPITLDSSAVSLGNLEFCLEAGLSRASVARIAMANGDLEMLQHCHAHRWPWNHLLLGCLPTSRQASVSLEWPILLKWALEHGCHPPLVDVVKLVFNRVPVAGMQSLLEFLLNASEGRLALIRALHLLVECSGYDGRYMYHRKAVQMARTLDTDALAWLLHPLHDQHHSTATAMLLAINRHPLSAEQILANLNQYEELEDSLPTCIITAEASDSLGLLDKAVRMYQAQSDQLPDLVGRAIEECPSLRVAECLWNAAGQPPNVLGGARWAQSACPCDAGYLYWAAQNGLPWDAELVLLLVINDRADLLQEISCSGFVVPNPPNRRYRPSERTLPEVLAMFMGDRVRWAPWFGWVPLKTAIDLGRIDWLQALLGPTDKVASHKHRLVVSDVIACFANERDDMLELLRPLKRFGGGSGGALSQLSPGQLQRALEDPDWRRPLKQLIEADGHQLTMDPTIGSLLLKANCLARFADPPWAWIGDRLDRLTLCVEQYGLLFTRDAIVSCLESGALQLLTDLFAFCDQLIANDHRLRILLWFANQFPDYEIEIHPAGRALRSLELAWLNDSNTLEHLIQLNEGGTQQWFNDTRSKYGLQPLGFPGELREEYGNSPRRRRLDCT